MSALALLAAKTITAQPTISSRFITFAIWGMSHTFPITLDSSLTGKTDDGSVLQADEVAGMGNRDPIPDRRCVETQFLQFVTVFRIQQPSDAAFLAGVGGIVSSTE